MPKNRYHVNKKIVLLIITIILLFSIIIGVVVAYYVNSDKNNNQFTVGENENRITEKFEPPSEQKEDSNKYLKQVQVENTGSVPCYVRLYVSFSDSQILNYSKFSDDTSLDGATFYDANPSAGNSFAKYLQSENNTGNWTYIETDDNSNLNGYYYYTKPIELNQSTEPLFRWIDTDYHNNGEAIQQYEVLVYSETVQTLDSNGNEYTDDLPWKSAWNEFLQEKSEN